MNQPANAPEVSESRAQVQLLSFRSTDQPGAYVEMSPAPTAHEPIHRPSTQPQNVALEPVVLPPMPLPSMTASARGSPRTQTDNARRQPARTAEHPSRYSDPPVSSTEYVKLAQREPLQVAAYAALSRGHRRVQAGAEDLDSESGAYVNVPKSIRNRSHYTNVAHIV